MLKFTSEHAISHTTSNPFVNLRLGQALFESDQMEKPKIFLLREFMLDGKGIFRLEAFEKRRAEVQAEHQPNADGFIEINRVN